MQPNSNGANNLVQLKKHHKTYLLLNFSINKVICGTCPVPWNQHDRSNKEKLEPAQSALLTSTLIRF